MNYKVIVSPAAEKFAMRLSPPDYLAVRRAIASLEDEPRGVHSKKLVGSDLCRLRIKRFRVIYPIDDKQRLAIVERIARRSESTYRGL